MTDSVSYATSLASRRKRHRLDRCAVFGLGWGLLILIVASAQRWTVIGAWDQLWEGLLALGAALVAFAVVCPFALALPERVSRQALGWVGSVLIRGALLVVFLLFVTPVGLILRRVARSQPVRSWDANTVSNPPYGWQPYVDPGAHDSRAGSGLGQRVPVPLKVLLYFARSGRWWLLPALIVLLLLGMLLFFAQTSVLAPLIYPLF